MGTGMKSLKWEGIGTKNLFLHTSNVVPLFTGHRRNIIIIIIIYSHKNKNMQDTEVAF